MISLLCLFFGGNILDIESSENGVATYADQKLRIFINDNGRLNLENEDDDEDEDSEEEDDYTNTTGNNFTDLVQQNNNRSIAFTFIFRLLVLFPSFSPMEYYLL
jgi:hypothetical protein